MNDGDRKGVWLAHLARFILVCSLEASELLAAGVLGHCLGPLADGVFAQLSGQVKADGRLDLATGDRVLLVVVRQSRGLSRDPLEDVVDEGVHDAHGLAGDAGVRVDLLQDLVDVDGVALFPSPLSPLRTVGFGSAWPQSCRLLLAFLCRYFPRHGGRQLLDGSSLSG